MPSPVQATFMQIAFVFFCLQRFWNARLASWKRFQNPKVVNKITFQGINNHNSRFIIFFSPRVSYTVQHRHNLQVAVKRAISIIFYVNLILFTVFIIPSHTLSSCSGVWVPLRDSSTGQRAVTVCVWAAGRFTIWRRRLQKTHHKSTERRTK